VHNLQPQSLLLQIVQYHEYTPAVEDWIKCLFVEGAYEASSEAISNVCGAYPSPRPHIWMVIAVELYFAGLGLVPSIVFGVTSDARQSNKSSLGTVVGWIRRSQLSAVSTASNSGHKLIWRSGTSSNSSATPQLSSTTRTKSEDVPDYSETGNRKNKLARASIALLTRASTRRVSSPTISTDMLDMELHEVYTTAQQTIELIPEE
jgi:hypothetical protein